MFVNRQEFKATLSMLLKPGEKTYTQRCRLFVGNLPNDITEEAFRKLFAKYGEPSEVFINKGKGFGFIRLVSESLVVNFIDYRHLKFTWCFFFVCKYFFNFFTWVYYYNMLCFQLVRTFCWSGRTEFMLGWEISSEFSWAYVTCDCFCRNHVHLQK